MNTHSSSKDRRWRDAGLRRHRRGHSVHVDRLHPVVRVTTVARRHIVPGAVLLARVPFAEDASVTKIRPVIVHCLEGDAVVVQPCTSSPEGRRSPGCLEIGDLNEAGLNRATSALARIVRLTRTDLIEVQGHLSEVDARRLLPWLTASSQGAA